MARLARLVLHVWITWLLSAVLSLAFKVSVQDTDYSRQVCSGMWGGSNTLINVTFEPQSQGQLAMVIYEWSDAPYLGKWTDTSNEYLPKMYVCTTSAVSGGYCSRSELGRFILDLPEGISVNDTSFWSARVAFLAADGDTSPDDTSELRGNSSGDDFWHNPAGDPTPPPSENESPWRRTEVVQRNESPDGVYQYHDSIQYIVRGTGYYCVAIVPVTATSTYNNRAPTDVPFHPSYKGVVLFQNTFQGELPATDYPKVNFYLVMFLLYAVFGAIWGWLCYKHVHELLPLQYYLSGLVVLLVIEMMANWVYYRYLNAHGRTTASVVFLIVVAILDAGRNAMSFFMLLVVSLGLSVVRESLGRTMLKCQILALLHFIFGVIYAVGIVELELESISALILLLFVVPLAITLSGFLLWIMYSLNATIAQLRARKQRYKLGMFQRLYYVLLFVVVIIGIFFVVSSMTFSGRLAEDYAARSWRVRWWLLDGWLALLYLDELAQDEEDAEDYDLESLDHRSRARDDDDNATLVAGHRLASDQVVFEIGDEDGASDDEDTPGRRKSIGRLSGEDHQAGSEEREALMTRDNGRLRSD